MSLLFSPPPVTTRVVESVSDMPLVDSDDASYRRLGAAPRDLQGTTLIKAMNLSVALYRANPLANRIISIYRSFMSGVGFDITATNPEVDAVVSDFWKGPRNRLDRNHSNYTRDHLLMGETHLPIAEDQTGNLTVGYIDPVTVEKILRDPTNNMLLTDIEVRAGLTAETETLRIVGMNTDPTEPDAGLWKGQVCTWLFDRIAAGTRGTPFLLPVLDWLDAYDQVLWELLERQKALRSHFWAVTVQGGENEVAAAQALFGTTAPRTGSVRYQTDAMKIDAVSPTLGTSDDVPAAQYQHRHIASGVGLAPHWLGDPNDTNRSTAESMDVPVLRSLADTQDEWARNTVELAQVAVDAKVRARMLPPILPVVENGQPVRGSEKPAREHVKVVAPEIEDRKVVDAAAALASTASAFISLDMLGTIRRDTMVKVVRQMLPALGIPADELPAPDADADMQISALESYRRYADALA